MLKSILFLVILSSTLQTHSVSDQLFSDPSETVLDSVVPRVIPHRNRRQQTDTNSTSQPQNTTLNDSHDYYTSRLYLPATNKLSEVWVELSTLPHTQHYPLSNGYFIAQSFQLDFPFPFYGRNLTQLYITTHGFISTSPFVHSLLPYSQYIAPFSANFNPNLSGSSAVHILSETSRFIVQWDQLYLNGTNQSQPFTFQAQLLPCGQIRFAYQKAPLTVQQANQSTYNSFIGLADGFIWRSVIYTYIIHFHDVTLSHTANLEGSVYYMDPLPSCAQATRVDECRNVSCATDFTCNWCVRSGKCIQTESSLAWRLRNGCPTQYQTGFPTCQADSTTSFLPTCYSGRATSPQPSTPTDAVRTTNVTVVSSLVIKVGLPVAAVLVLLLLVAVIVVIVLAMVWRLRGRGRAITITTDKLSFSDEIIIEPEDAKQFEMNEYS